VESGTAARTMAAYIDPNPVRAGVVGLALVRKTSNAKLETSRKTGISQNDGEAMESGENQTVLPELSIARMLRCRVRYFTDGAVIGSKSFVNEAFAGGREGFSERRQD